MVKFIVLFTGRAGSHFLADTLGNHENIICRNEPSIILLDRYFVRKTWPEEVLATGFTYQFQGIDDAPSKIGGAEKLREYIQTEQVKVIHLHRENIVKHTLSGVVGNALKEKIGKYHIYDTKDIVTPLYIDITKFRWDMVTRLEAERSLFVFLNTISVPALHYSYEDLCMRHTDKVITHIQSFLEVPHINVSDISSRQLKATTDNMEDAIINFDEFKYEISTFGKDTLTNKHIFDKYF